MIFEGFEVNRDKKDYFANPNLRVEDKTEAQELHNLFMLEHEVSLVSSSAKTILKKYGKDIIEMLSEKYPENVIAEDFGKFKEYLDSTKK